MRAHGGLLSTSESPYVMFVLEYEEAYESYLKSVYSVEDRVFILTLLSLHNYSPVLRCTDLLCVFVLQQSMAPLSTL